MVDYNLFTRGIHILAYIDMSHQWKRKLNELKILTNYRFKFVKMLSFGEPIPVNNG